MIEMGKPKPKIFHHAHFETLVAMKEAFEAEGWKKCTSVPRGDADRTWEKHNGVWMDYMSYSQVGGLGEPYSYMLYRWTA